MHEASIVRSLYEAAEAARTQHGLDSVELVKIQVGTLQHVVDEVMHTYFSFEAEQWPAFAGARLVIERLPARLLCLDCGHETELDDPVFACDACDSRNTRLLSGMELDLVSMNGTAPD
ncbi:MAG: hydrogenase maturation nickel metallochaperone HypA [Candidatus Cloacimonetes bacterium]|nr:hydrogenase maturation nickel metallochaperone HypA [Candidatus Cloacimonadota bacterium]